MTFGGLVVVLTTAGIAIAHGNLPALVGAVLVGYSGYVSTRRVLNLIPESVERTQKHILELDMQREIAKHLEAAKSKDRGEPDKEDGKIKAIRKEAQTMMAGLHEVCERDRWGNREMAACVGVAGCAYPPLGVALLAGNLAVMFGALNPKPQPRAPIDWEAALKQNLGKTA